MEDSPAAGWAPVVYGRTEAADTWWQAIPAGITSAGWLAQVVYCVFAGGRELEEHPRFLLAQQLGHRIIGVACPARDLSREMHTDGTRELYCFVGWIASLPGGTDQLDSNSRAIPNSMTVPDGPSFEEIRSNYSQWAAPVYTEIMAPLWQTPVPASHSPVTTQRREAPWNPGIRRQVGLVPRPGTGLWPAQTWPFLWAAAMATSAPLTCVVGWQHVGSARRDGVTHLGAANAAYREIPILPQPEPEPEPIVPARQVSPPELVPAQRLSPPETAADEASFEPPQLDLETGAVPRGDNPIARRRWSGSIARIQVLTNIRLRPGVRVPATLSRISLSRRAKLGVSIGLAAVVAITLVIALGGGPAPNKPVSVTYVTITSKARATPRSLLVYQHLTLLPGPRTVRIALLAGTSPANRAVCVVQLGRMPPNQVHPRTGQRICLKLKGQPISYGIAIIERATTDSVMATITIWSLSRSYA